MSRPANLRPGARPGAKPGETWLIDVSHLDPTMTKPKPARLCYEKGTTRIPMWRVIFYDGLGSNVVTEDRLVQRTDTRQLGPGERDEVALELRRLRRRLSHMEVLQREVITALDELKAKRFRKMAP